MTVNRTTLLDLPLPVTGTESGTWGDTTNNGLTQYLDIAIAGTLVLSTDADVTLTSTEGDSSATYIGATTAQYAILRWTATGSTTRNITALAQSKTYVVINATGGTQSIVLRGAGPTTGVTIISGEKAFCVWNGSDFVKVSSSAAAGGSNTQVQYNSSGVLAGVSGATTNGTAITFSTTNLKLQGSSTGVSSFASANSSATDYTVTFPAASTTIPVATQTLTFSGPTAARTITLPDANFTAARTDAAQTFTGTQTFSSNPVLDGGTANGVLYLNGSKVATSGSALTFTGSVLGVNNSGDSDFKLTTSNTGSGSTDGLLLRINSTGSEAYLWNWEPSSVLIFGANGSEQMRLTSTGLGIGTSSPGNKLTVKPSATSSGTFDVLTGSTNTDSIRLSGGGTVNTWLELRGYLGVKLYSDATNTVTVDSSGNLGLGVTPSAWGASGTLQALQIKNTSLAGSGTNAYWGSNWYGGGFDKYITTGAASLAVQTGGQHIWYTAPSGTADNAITFTQAMTLDASGRLGVGATSPTAQLVVQGTGASGWLVGARNVVQLYNTNTTATNVSNGIIFGDASNSTRWAIYNDLAANGSEANVLAFVNLGTERARIDSSGNLLVGGTSNSLNARLIAENASGNQVGIRYSGIATYYLNATSGGDLAINKDGSERARITSGGDLLVGTTSGSDKLVVEQSAAASASLFVNSSGTATAQCVNAWHKNTTGDNVFLQFFTEASATARGSITYNRAGGLVAYNTTSDYRAKDIIGPVTNSGEVIDSLKVYEGKMKGATQSRPMLIAHEAQAHAPYAVTGEKDAFNEDGTPKFQQIDVSSLVPLLLAEIQSLRQRVALLEGN